MRLHESVLSHVNSLSGLPEEGADLLGADTKLDSLVSLGALGHVHGEHVFRSINVLAEVVVVDLLGVSAVTVTANDQVKHIVAGRHDVKVFHHAQELLGSDVLALRAVKVCETGLQKDTVRHNMLVKGRHHLIHLLFLLFVEDLFEFV